MRVRQGRQRSFVLSVSMFDLLTSLFFFLIRVIACRETDRWRTCMHGLSRTKTLYYYKGEEMVPRMQGEQERTHRARFRGPAHTATFEKLAIALEEPRISR